MALPLDPLAMIVVGYRAAIEAAHRGFRIDRLNDPLAFLVFPLGDLSAFAVRDKRTLGTIHPVSLWGAIALFAYANLRAGLIGPSAPWHSFASWLVG